MQIGLQIGVLAFIATLALAKSTTVFAHGDNERTEDAEGDRPHMLQHMREMHKGHEHAHDFEAMEHMSHEEMDRVMSFMAELGLAMPPMNPARGRNLFLEKGCVACHAINGIGGTVGPSLNAAEMPEPMNTFEFAARMWRGASAMVAMQEAQFGEVIELDGSELADIIAFVHDEDEQRNLTKAQIPERYLDLIDQ